MVRTPLLTSVVALVCVGPLMWLGYLIAMELEMPGVALGADPGEAVVHYLGEWAIRALLLAFSMTPLYRLTRITAFAQYRRQVGLWAFCYVLIHLLAYLYFFLQFDLDALLEDFVERTYITAGMLAFFCLLPMAITSTRGWRIRLGTRWKQLHSVVYIAVLAAILHFFWFTRDQFGEVVLYTVWMLLAWGVRIYFKRKTPARATA